jgi:hypothetical protein
MSATSKRRMTDCMRSALKMSESNRSSTSSIRADQLL